MAYRGSMPFDAPRREAEGGIVDDMVRQFADPYAFLRELVQNAIDAGATRIDVTIERDAEVVRTSVEDDGTGMSRATIEGPLLTLFSSSKESDSTKIGKYGIGFVSVFAVDPVKVEVRTRRDGEGWLVRLFPDHSFELVRDARRDGHGTVVTLVQRLGPGTPAGDAHPKRCLEALVRWCRFAHVPIVLRDDGAPPRAINEPLSVAGLVSVVHEADGERIALATGAVPNATLGVGYYNRGLTLVERAEPLPGLEGVRVAIDSPKLSHTLSRDNVKQDGELRRVVALAKDLARGPLRDALAKRIVDAARAGAAEYEALVAAAAEPAFANVAPIVPEAVLLEPIEGATTMPMTSLLARTPRGAEILFADASSPVTRALARTGRPVVRSSSAMAVLGRFTGGRGIAHVDAAVAYAAPAEAHAVDEPLARALHGVLRAAGRAPARVLFAAFEGAGADALFRVLPADRADPIATAAEAAERTWGRSHVLFLGVGAAAVRLARRRAIADVAIAAHLLARVLLLASGPLDAKAVDALIAHAGGAHG